MTAQKPPSGPCALIAPGNWNASGWVPTCRLSAGHEGDHVSNGPMIFLGQGGPGRAPDHTWENQAGGPLSPVRATSDVPHAATELASLVLAEGCPHVRACGCRGRWRGRSWLVLDTLLLRGWTLTPPVSS